ncbi:formylglycine-generating enzyme family protein [Hymenobacter sp. DH14]|uniref:Formylglycine-generating enzyme family protein n=1 Tax=Hymenobacter cyanobacteriorum TaxID=2926463 RepID=A0A9X1VDK6_9BACT|nr:SUMF1/EgtB/PvdO family nonheme iron enzyme [Hymenobacter cyanobacteriorum]MCI1187199.1 formylglycine-generating enzyme family protein [Hymenobacter cyanobacteriorum]
MKHYDMLLRVLALLITLGSPCAAQTRQALLRSVEAPGVVPVGDSLFMDEAEVTNLHWMEYLHFLRNDSSNAFYQSQLPDTLRLRRWLFARHDTINKSRFYYYGYADFRHFPVVGVTYSQVVSYCRWRTAKVREGYLQSADFKKKHKKLLQQYDVVITYRLPTVAEWETAAAAALDPTKAPYGVVRPPVPGTAQYKRGLLRERNDFASCLPAIAEAAPLGAPIFGMEFNVLEKGYVGNTLAPFRCREKPGTSWSATDGTFPQYAYSNPPNGYGLFNMVGNVAELTATPGVAKGGSFGHSILDFTLKTSFPYDGPQEWLGFRCACVVELRRKAVLD